MSRTLKLPIFSRSGNLEKIVKQLRPAAFDVFCKATPNTPQIPEEAFTPFYSNLFMFASEPSTEQQVLIKRNAERILSLNFANDPTVARRLSYILPNAPHLQSLDLTNCTQVTVNDLASGHNNLKVLQLHGTQVDPAKVDRALFPALQKCENSSLKKVYRLDTGFSYLRNAPDSTWEKLTQEIGEADVMYLEKKPVHLQFSAQANRDFFEIIINDVFTQMGNNFTSRKLNLPITIRNQLRKIPESERQGIVYMGCPNPNGVFSDFDHTFIPRLLEVWESLPPESWDAGSTLGHKLTLLLFSLMNQNNQNVVNEKTFKLIWERNISLLHNIKPQKDRDDYKGSVTAHSSTPALKKKADFLRAREVLRALHNWSGPFAREILTKQAEKYAQLKEELGRAPIAKEVGPSGGDLRIDQLEFFMESILEMSHHESCSGDSELVKDIFITNLKKIPSNYMGQALACAFAAQIGNQASREAVLRHILKEFKGYKGFGNYPLSKLIVGAPLSPGEEIPQWNKDSCLAQRLVSCRGILSEDISPDIKDQFVRALIQGQFEGYTLSWFEALVHLYNRVDTTGELKERIKTAFRSVAKSVGDVGPSAAAFLDSLNSELEEGAI